MSKRVFIIVLDSCGCGEMPDSYLWNDEGSNTLGAIRKDEHFHCPNLINLGLFNIDTVGGGIANPKGSYARLKETSMGKDTTIGHWEIAGIISPKPLPTYPNGFPDDVIAEFEKRTGRKVLCNKPYSGTEVIKDYGEEHIKRVRSSCTRRQTACSKSPRTRTSFPFPNSTNTAKSRVKCCKASIAWAESSHVRSRANIPLLARQTDTTIRSFRRIRLCSIA